MEIFATFSAGLCIFLFIFLIIEIRDNNKKDKQIRALNHNCKQWFDRWKQCKQENESLKQR